MIARTTKGNEKLFELYKESGKQEYLSLYNEGWTFLNKGDRTNEILETLESKHIPYLKGRD